MNFTGNYTNENNNYFNNMFFIVQILCGPQYEVNIVGAAAATARRLGAASRPPWTRLLR